MGIELSEAWAAFIDMRKAKGKRAPFTELAKTRILFELRRMQADGQDVDEILWTSVTNAWSGVFPIKRKGWQQNPVNTATDPEFDLKKAAEQAKADEQLRRAMSPEAKAAKAAALAKLGRVSA
jgi:hypothetical protein